MDMVNNGHTGNLRDYGYIQNRLFNLIALLVWLTASSNLIVNEPTLQTEFLGLTFLSRT